MNTYYGLIDRNLPRNRRSSVSSHVCQNKTVDTVSTHYSMNNNRQSIYHCGQAHEVTPCYLIGFLSVFQYGD